jgi:hypothetical protein
LLITTCGAAFLTGILEWHRHQPAYAMPLMVVVVAAFCVVLIALGGVLALKAGQPTSWLAPVLVLAVIFGFFLLGILVVIPLVLIMLVLLRDRPAGSTSASRWQRVGAPLLLTLGIVPLTWLSVDRAVVECSPNGVSLATPPWTLVGGGSGTYGQSGGPNFPSGPQKTSGSLTLGGVTYTFTCDGTRLVHFTSR